MFHIPELTDQIIDHLHADLSALQNCALVSRLWVPASQYHIFYSINLKNDGTCRTLCDIIADSPHIGRYIRHIYIYFEADRPSFTSLIDLRIPEPRRLSIVNCPHTEELARIAHLINLPSLTDVRFFSGSSISRAQLDYLARTRTTMLSNLLLYSASDTPAGEDKDKGSWSMVEQPLEVATLNIGGDATLTTGTLVDPHGPIRLRTISTLTFESDDIGCLPRLLKICGQDLLVLEILIASESIASDVHIGHSTIPHLIDLLLSDITAETLPGVLQLLSQLAPGAPLRTLRLVPKDPSRRGVCSAFEPTKVNCALWRKIDNTLGALEDVVQVDVNELWAMQPAWGTEFLECVPKLVKKGVLVVRPSRWEAESPPASPISSRSSLERRSPGNYAGG
ncbi:hypothetical protein C8R43DRAFT_1243608 [Mycena crocata]|nr:hypothetical protein C8R43DRAFT_1243608 [Mycena crocata]